MFWLCVFYFYYPLLIIAEATSAECVSVKDFTSQSNSLCIAMLHHFLGSPLCNEQQDHNILFIPTTTIAVTIIS